MSSMAMQPYVDTEVSFDRSWMERIILELADTFEIRVSWSGENILMVGACAVVGGLLGNYAGGRVGAAVGSSLGAATGVGIATVVSLREIWSAVKEKLQELLYIVFNFLRQFDPIDYVNALELLMACRSSRRELLTVMLDVIATKLGRDVFSALTAA